MNSTQKIFTLAALIAAGVCSPITTPVLAQSAASLAFQNTVKGPPPNWKGPVFKLSRDYPTFLPGECAECTWLKVDVDFSPKFPPPAGNSWASGNWSEYLKRVLDYVKQGQDPQLSKDRKSVV